MDTKPINQPGVNLTKQIGTGKLNQKDLGKVDDAKAEEKARASNISRDQTGVDVALSSSAKELAEAHAKALDIALNTPDINEQRVEELKKKIQTGTYKINAAGIADGILKEAVLERLAETER